ncbi:MAG: RNA 2',3'-cyclic phosphodiesterase [Rubrivivax sp.]|nr:RNA 2',3'-cyclic phosphodiesterase [Rubrivivax sp.]
MRLFFGVAPAAPLRALLQSGSDELRRLPAGAGLRWLDPASYHMTLAFLGQVADARLEALLAAARGGLREAPASQPALGELVWLPQSSRPRVLAVMVRGDERLLATHAALCQALARAGFALERRPLLPHITLARCQRRPPDLRELAGAWRSGGAAWPVAAVTLFESRLLPGGARYRRLATLPLGDAGPAGSPPA